MGVGGLLLTQGTGSCPDVDPCSPLVYRQKNRVVKLMKWRTEVKDKKTKNIEKKTRAPSSLFSCCGRLKAAKAAGKNELIR